MHSILFVDDEPGILRTLERMFRRENLELFFALGAEEALAILRSHPIDLIVSDLRMPGVDGIELMKQVQELSPDTIRVILTGYANVDTAIKAINEGHVFQFVTKPWDDEELRITVRRCLRQADLIRENRELQERIRKQNEMLKELNEELENRVMERTRELTLHNQALRISQNILHNLPIPLFGISVEGIVVLANQAGARLFPEHSQIIGANYENIFPGDLVLKFRQQKVTSDFDPVKIGGKDYLMSTTELQFSDSQKGILVMFLPQPQAVTPE